MIATTPEPGTVWTHYKGTSYKVIAVAKMEADPLIDAVVYQALYPPYTVWVRPRESWYEIVSALPDYRGPRFQQMVGRIL